MNCKTPKDHASNRKGFKTERNKIKLPLSKQTKDYLKTAHSIESNYIWISLPKKLIAHV